MLRSSGSVAFCLVLAYAALAGCGARSGGGQAPEALGEPVRRISTANPIQAYSAVGRLVHRCWLNPREPLLPNHEYQAEASPAGNKAQILIVERTPTGALRSFSIDFEVTLAGTDIRPTNHRVPEPLGQKLVDDVRRWGTGDLSCRFDN